MIQINYAAALHFFEDAHDGRNRRQIHGTINKVRTIARQFRMVAGEFDGTAAARETQSVQQIDWMHHCFQRVETVVPFAENIQQQVDLAR